MGWCSLLALPVIPLFTSIFTSAENFLSVDVKSYLFKEIDFPFCHAVGGFHFFSMCCENKLVPTSDVRLVIHHSQHSRAFIPFLCQIGAVMVYQTDRLQKLFFCRSCSFQDAISRQSSKTSKGESNRSPEG